MTVTGLLGTQTVASLMLPISASTAATFNFGSPWASLTSVSFSSDVVGFSLDNINVNAVPEPTSVLLVGLGLAGLLVSSRRKAALH